MQLLADLGDGGLGQVAFHRLDLLQDRDEVVTPGSRGGRDRMVSTLFMTAIPTLL